MSAPDHGGGSHPVPAGEAGADGSATTDGPRALAAPGPAPGSFAMAAVVTGFALYLTYGLLTLDAVEAEEGPGPAFFPTLILVLAWVVAVGLVIDAARQRRRAARARAGGAPTTGGATTGGTTGAQLSAPGTTEDRTDQEAPTDWRAVVVVAAVFAVFIAVLEPLGWLLAGTWLFWGVAQALGSRRHLFDLGVALAIASIVQLAFGAGLGLNLPAGVLGAF